MKKLFKNVVFGLIFALISIFAISSSSFISVKVNAVESENQETQEGVTYTYEDDYGTCSITFYEDGTCYVFALIQGEAFDGTLNYAIVGDIIVLIGPDGEELLLILNEDMTFTPLAEEEVETNPEIKDEIIEEEKPIVEEEQKEILGFIEENWKIFVASCGGTISALALLLYWVIKFIIKSTDMIDKGDKNNKKNNENADKISNVVIKVNETTDKINTLEITLNEKYTALNEEQKKIKEEQKEQLKELQDTINNMCKAFIVMVGNDNNLVSKGIAEKVTKVMQPKGSDTDEEQEL